MNKHFSGKRFYWDRALEKFHDRKTDEDYYLFEDACQIADLLNQYDEENGQLKKGIVHYNLLKEDIKTVLDYIGTNIILNYARMDDIYSLNDRERLAYIRLSKSIGEGYDDVDLEKW